AFFIEFRTPYGNGVLARVQCDNATTYTAFTWQTHPEGVFTRFIVKSAGLHNGIDSLSHTGGDDRFIAETAVVGVEHECAGELCTRHFNGALPVVEIEYTVDIIF